MEKLSRRRENARPVTREAVPSTRNSGNVESLFTLRDWLSELESFAQKFEHLKPDIKQEAGMFINQPSDATEKSEGTATFQPSAMLAKGNDLFGNTPTGQFHASSSEVESNARQARENVLLTPQADLGIGPVQYNIKFPPGGGIAERPLSYLNTLVELEKKLGDYSIKFEATLLCVVFGVEDPLIWLPSAQRLAIRSATRK
jgi:hypothetical protein